MLLTAWQIIAGHHAAGALGHEPQVDADAGREQPVHPLAVDDPEGDRAHQDGRARAPRLAQARQHVAPEEQLLADRREQADDARPRARARAAWWSPWCGSSTRARGRVPTPSRSTRDSSA